VPGSTTKLITMGSALHLLGADYRFHTRVYRTGEVDAAGVLRGDLVLVASGDPNLSGRIRADGTLAFENVDHSYGGVDSHGVEGDPLAVIRELAASIAAKGVTRITGRVIVDASLYAEGERDGGTRFVISPIIVNDNAIDVVVRPGAREGEPAALSVSPQTAYVRVVNRATTGAAKTDDTFHVASDIAEGDGSRVVTYGGSVAADAKPAMAAYRVPQPTRFAEMALAEALHERGIVAAARQNEDRPDFAKLAAGYTPARMIAEHVSAPFAEEVKVTLKVSQNLHASATPFLLGALAPAAGGESRDAAARGFIRIRNFLDTTGADVSGASQRDGAGADAHFTPDFIVHYLEYMAQGPDAAAFRDALPVLGRDGTLWNVQVSSPAAGALRAKTGTYAVDDLLHEALFVTGKGLAGYLTTKDGQHLAVAVYANNIPVRNAADVTPVVGEAVAEIAASAYDAKLVR
jgi:D-alanyl-D-alanine carboxypeptidase/D-alanyl-D-alanine-endopeptidase (penicillin-binding protein 4)